MTTPLTSEAMSAGGGGSAPTSDQRSPSTTPTSGFRAYTVRQPALTSEDGNTIGLKKNQICRRNGSTCRTSRYLTLSAASHVPTPNATSAAAAIHSGTSSTCGPGATLYTTRTTAASASEMARSRSPGTTAAAGDRMRGKYTRVTRCGFCGSSAAAAETDADT